MAYLATTVNTSPVISQPAGGNLGDIRGLGVKFNGSGNIVKAAANDAILGVALMTNDENIQTGADVNIQTYGIGAVKAGAEIAKGANLSVDENGAFITATSGTVVAIALQAAPAAGTFIQAKLK